jgi:hypothetical protein
MTQPTPRPGHIDTDRLVAASELLSAQEAAELIGISTSTLTRRVQEGALRPLRRDPLIFHKDDVAQLRPAGN